ncbi:hypothetical protein [Alternaria alternata polymycovirus 1]|nr:hypothetical protein [Alternaria alternata polymycovirus 1]
MFSHSLPAFSPAMVDHMLSTMQPQAFSDMMDQVNASGDALYLLQLLSAGTVPPGYAKYFTLTAPLPMVIDPFSLLSGAPGVLEALGIDEDEVFDMLEAYMADDGDDCEELMDELCSAASDSAPGSEARPISQIVEYPPLRTEVKTSTNPPPNLPEDSPEFRQWSQPLTRAPAFKLLPEGPNAYAVVVGPTSVVVGPTMHEAIANAFGYHALQGFPPLDEFTLGTIDQISGGITFKQLSFLYGEEGVVPPLPTKWDLLKFIARSFKAGKTFGINDT